MTARNVAFIESVLELTGRSVFADASKDAIRVRFMRSGKLDVRVIHLVRDPRGNVNSIRKNQGRPAREGAKMWRNAHATIERLAGPQYGAYLRVRYEDLCSAEEQTLGRIHDFLSLPHAPVPPVFGDSLHVIGNRMRLAPDRVVRADESWRHQLTSQDLRDIRGVAGPLSARYGYDLGAD